MSDGRGLPPADGTATPRPERRGVDPADPGVRRPNPDATRADEPVRPVPGSGPDTRPGLPARTDPPTRPDAPDQPRSPWTGWTPFRIAVIGALGFALVYLLYQAVASIRDQLIVVVVAAFLAIGLNPIVTRLERLGLRRGFAVAVVFLATLGFLALFGFAILPPVIEQVGRFVNAVPDYIDSLQSNETIRRLDERYHLLQRAQEYLAESDIGPSAASGVFNIGRAVAGGLINVLTVLVLMLYFLSSFNRIKHTAYRLLPRSRRVRGAQLGDEILSRVGGYVAGAIAMAFISGSIALIWVSALGVPYPLALALSVTITDVIPLVGGTIGAVIVSSVAAFNSLPLGIATAIFFVVYRQLRSYLIYPRVMKKSVDVHPAGAIVAVFLGAALLGIPGALLAIPTTAAIQIIMREVVFPRQDNA